MRIIVTDGKTPITFIVEQGSADERRILESKNRLRAGLAVAQGRMEADCEDSSKGWYPVGVSGIEAAQARVANE